MARFFARSRFFARYSLALIICVFAYSGSPKTSSWTLARTNRLEVYSQDGADRARQTLARFAHLQAFFDQVGLIPVSANVTLPILRVISFRSEKEYEDFRLRSNADAYYAGSENQAYIVTPGMHAVDSAIGAHEYAHYFLHAAGLKLPVWLDEGLAEFFSTVRIANRGCTLGGVLPARLETLHRHRWLPLSELVALAGTPAALQTRDGASLFYAESWALVDLLVLSPEYAPRFHDLIATLNTGKASAPVLTSIYGRSLESIARDLQVRVSKHIFNELNYQAVPQAQVHVEISGLSDAQSTALLADLLTAEGRLQQAEALYSALAQHSPKNQNVLAALGAIAIREHEPQRAIQYWREAMAGGVEDADICYRYALLADDAGLPTAEIRRALERAVLLKPHFDDARYKLALLESNAGDFPAAVRQFLAIRSVPPARAFSYWAALSYASMESGDRDTAKNAAQQARKCAPTAANRLRANQLEYMADTDVAVQFAHDADGRSRLEQIRVPHGTSDWNPFIEPTDQIKQAEGQLREIVCAAGKLRGILVETPNGSVVLDIPDPRHVLMTNGPVEFTCGPQPLRLIKVQYASAYANASTGGVVRGIAFR